MLANKNLYFYINLYWINDETEKLKSIGRHIKFLCNCQILLTWAFHFNDLHPPTSWRGLPNPPSRGRAPMIYAASFSWFLLDTINDRRGLERRMRWRWKLKKRRRRSCNWCLWWCFCSGRCRRRHRRQTILSYTPHSLVFQSFQTKTMQFKCTIRV